MKRLMVSLLTLMLCMAPLAVQAETLREYATRLKSIATNDGLTVMSPEEFLSIDPCDNLSKADTHYTYVYTNRGYKYHNYGTTIPVDWFQMQEYVNALVESGYYEIMEYSSDPDDAYWLLGYTGPATVKNTFSLHHGMTDRTVIALRNFIGDIKVYYSKDILTTDIDETQQRLGKYVVDTYSSATASSTTSDSACTYCGGDGKCDRCGGDMWYWDYEWVYVNGSPVSQRVNKMCQATYCTGGACSKCGGDGVR